MIEKRDKRKKAKERERGGNIEIKALTLILKRAAAASKRVSTLVLGRTLSLIVTGVAAGGGLGGTVAVAAAAVPVGAAVAVATLLDVAAAADVTGADRFALERCLTT